MVCKVIKENSRWPCSTAIRHVSHIDDDKCLVVGLLTLKTDTGSSSSVFSLGIHTPRRFALVEQAQALSLCLVNIFDETMCRIRAGEKVKFGVEVLRHVVILESVRS